MTYPTLATTLVAQRLTGIACGGPTGHLSWSRTAEPVGHCLPEFLLPGGLYGSGARVRVTVELIHDATPEYLADGLWERNDAATGAAHHALRTLTGVQDWGYGLGPWEQVPADHLPVAQLIAREWIDQQLADTTATAMDRARLHAKATDLVAAQWQAADDRRVAAEQQEARRAARQAAQ